MFIKELSQYKNQKVTLRGWIYNFRSSGSIMFWQLRDGTGFVQCILNKADVDDKKWDEAQKVTLETSVEVGGLVTEHPKQPGVFELQVKDFKFYQIPKEEYPISKKEHGPEFLLDNRHLWLRSKRQWAIQRVRDTLISGANEWLHQNNFVKFDSPILTPAACEGTTTLFGVEYFDLGKAYLSQSGQLYLEAAIASLGRVYDFGPVFRAEKSKTRRHLTEFWMMDAEAAFVEHDENLKIQEELISFMVQKVLKENQEELKILERDIKPLENIKPPFYRITHAEVVKKLKEQGSDIGDMDDLGGDDETTFSKQYDKPIFVEKYPAEVKAFYMKRDPKNPKYVLNADLLAPEGYGEIIGGSEREDSYDELLKRIKEHKLPVDAFKWYLDLRQFGSVPHSGFGFGLERIV
ncbi:MAG: asparagine--tRNA ligase, partial [Patescibacteria group bacterium]|nr:asparagine--tRNA ligase [Patescibacteria group bacterium]